MNKNKIAVIIPLAIVGVILIYCWAIFITTDLLATWRHYLAIGLYFALVVIFAKSLRYSTVGLGIYLLFATFALVAITPTVMTNWIRIGPISTPPVQLFSLGIFILYAVLNLNPLIDLYLDYQDGKISRKTTAPGDISAVDDTKEKR